MLGRAIGRANVLLRRASKSRTKNHARSGSYSAHVFTYRAQMWPWKICSGVQSSRGFCVLGRGRHDVVHGRIWSYVVHGQTCCYHVTQKYQHKTKQEKPSVSITYNDILPIGNFTRIHVTDMHYKYNHT